MTITQDPWSNKSTDLELQTITCPVCSYRGNELGSTNCWICHQSLVTRTTRNSKQQRTKKQSQQNIRRYKIKTLESIAEDSYSYFVNCFIKFKTQLITFWQRRKIPAHLKRYCPNRKILINPLGALIISLILSLVLSQTKLFDSGQVQNQNQNRQQLTAELEKSLRRDTSGDEKPLTLTGSNLRVKRSVKTELPKSENEPMYYVPTGLFSYGGAFFSSPMVLGKLNQKIESTHKDFKWRYTELFDAKLNSSTGIKMLIEGNLTLAFSTRPVNDYEIERASKRDSTLKQTPIAIDGLVFFANNKLPISANLNVEQISKIYRGEINNWNLISVKAGNIPIVPLFLDNEDINVLGLKQPSVSARQISNYNQLLSQVNSIPGAISFLSASLIQEPQLLKIFSLANSDRPSNYIPALINGIPNLNAFRDGSYPLTRKLFVVYKQDGTDEQNAGEAYVNFLNTKGQKVIKQSGFVPLRDKL
jgi:phosphate transport system substrate-binding protein